MPLTKRVDVTLSIVDYAWLKILAKEKGKSLSAYIRESVARHIAKEERKEQRKSIKKPASH